MTSVTCSPPIQSPIFVLQIHRIRFHPTYGSMYPPAQGLLLLAGRVLGHPFVGVVLSLRLMCAAICWMLQAWLPPGWTLLGGLLPITRIGMFTYWANSYCGGAAAIGGALVLGAWPRIVRCHRFGDALLFGLGLAILANSRPYEGFSLALPVALSLFLWMLGSRRPPPKNSLGACCVACASIARHHRRSYGLLLFASY